MYPTSGTEDTLPLIGHHVHRAVGPRGGMLPGLIDSPHTRDRWAIELAARARAYWTPARTAELARGKQLLLPPAEAAPLLRALGLLRDDASMPPPEVRKYFQINHMVALLGPGLRELRGRHPAIRLLDAGCGRSYLTLLVAWCAKHVWGHPLEVLGVDRNPAVIEEVRRRSALARLDDVVRFEAGALDALDVRAAWARAFGDGSGAAVGDGGGGAIGDGGGGAVHGVIALHACDTASCDALALGVALGAELIAVAPCCQAELARAWAELDERGEAGAFAPIWGAPHLRRETAAHVTDAMRTLLVRAAGYEVRAMEFVPAEHTAKNTLIRAIKRSSGDAGARAEYEALRAATGGAGLALAARLAAG
jgi:SAM-dependent methyltransferase